MRVVIVLLVTLFPLAVIGQARVYEGEMRVLEREGIKCSPATPTTREVSLALMADGEDHELGLAIFGGKELPAAEFQGTPAAGYSSRVAIAGSPANAAPQIVFTEFSDARIKGHLVQASSKSPECRTRRAELSLERVNSEMRAAQTITELRVNIAALKSYARAFAAFQRREFGLAHQDLDNMLVATKGQVNLLYPRRLAALLKVRVLNAERKDDAAATLARETAKDFAVALGSDHPWNALLLVELSRAEELANWPESVVSAERAVKLAVRVHGPTHPETIDARYALANALRIKSPERALVLLEESIPIVEASYGITSPHAMVVFSAAVQQAASTGHLSKSVAWSERLIAALEREPGGINSQHQPILAMSAATQALIGKLPKARMRARQNIALVERNGTAANRDLLFALELAAIIETEFKDYAAAIALLERELAIIDQDGGNSQPSRGPALRLMGDAKLKSGDSRAAASILAEAEPLLAKLGPAFERMRVGALVGHGVAMARLDDFETALVDIRRAAEISSSGVSQGAKNWVTWGWYEYFKKKGPLDAAIFFGKLQIELRQDLRRRSAALSADMRASLTESVSPEYQEVADLLVQAGRLPEAQAILAMLKEDELYEFASRDARMSALGATVELTPNEKTLRKRLEIPRGNVAALGAELEAIRSRSGTVPLQNDEKRRDQITDELRRANAAFIVSLDNVIAEFATAPAIRNREIGEKNLLALKALQGTLRDLGDSVVAIHYVVASERLHAILTTPTVQLVRSTNVTSAELNRRVFALRERLASPAGDPVPAARALYDLLLAPIADDLKQTGAKSLLVSLDGTLRYVPIASLHDGERFVLERYRVSVLTDAARGSLKDRPAAHWSISGLGVTKGFPGFIALPSVREELDGILKVGINGASVGERYFDEDFDLRRL